MSQTTLLLLDKSETVFKRVPPKNLIELYETQEIKAANQINGMLLAKDYMTDFETAKYVAIANGETKEYHIYALINWKINNDQQIIFSGIDEAHFELDGDGFIQDRRFVLNDFSKIIQPIFEGSRWTIRTIPKDIPVGTINFYFESRLTAINELIDYFDVDVEFSYQITNNKIINRYVDIYDSYGKDTGKRFAYGSNLLSVVKETSTTDLYTAIVPRGDGIAKQDETGKDTGGYSRKINISDEYWAKSKGDPLDKPKGQLYLEMPDRTKEFGYASGRPKVLIKDYDGIKQSADLIRQCYLDLETVSRPKVQFTTSLTNLGDANLGDTLTITMPKYKIEYKTRIFKLKLDLLTNTRSVAEFGDYVVKTAGQRAYDMWLKQKKTDDSQEDVNAGLSDTIDQNQQTQLEWNDNQEAWNNEQEALNKQIESWKSTIQEDINNAIGSVGDHINNQDQLGEIIFTGKDKLPTKNNIYNIVARSSINGSQGQLVFNSNGLGYYKSNGQVKMAISNDGRVVADSIYNNTLDSLTVKTAHLMGGLIEGVQFKSTGNGQFMSISSDLMMFGRGTDGSNPLMKLTGSGLNFFDTIGGWDNISWNTIGKKGDLIGGFRLMQGRQFKQRGFGSSIVMAASENHVISLGKTSATSNSTSATTVPFITISGGGAGLDPFGGGVGQFGYEEGGVYIEDGVRFFGVNSNTQQAYLLAHVWNGRLTINSDYANWDSLGNG